MFIKVLQDMYKIIQNKMVSYRKKEESGRYHLNTNYEIYII